jgi:RNA polymerase sigma-70 factor, ECF subfamily
MPTPTEQPPSYEASPDDLRLVKALRNGDESAFAELVDRHHAAMVRLATSYVRSRAVAEEVTQEAWLGVLQSLPRFEGRSSLRTWIFRILANQAKTRAERERRTVPFSSLTPDNERSSVDPSRFLGAGHPANAGHWASPPRRWDEQPETSLLSGEATAVVLAAIDGLPAAQREVITLRDVDGWSSAEVCDLLGLTEGNQRVLLHRGRSKVRAKLESYYDDTGAR